MGAAYLGSRETQEAAGAIEAQKIITALQSEAVTADLAWLRFTELAARHGWKSSAARAFVIEIAKRAAK